MSNADVATMVSVVSGHSLRIRTAILLLDVDRLGSEPAIAARLGMGAVDFAARVLSRDGASPHFLGLSRESILREFDTIANEEERPEDCLLVYNVDLVLAAVPEATERERFWSFLKTNFKRRKALVVAVSSQADGLLSGSIRREWASDGRLAELHNRED